MKEEFDESEPILSEIDRLVIQELEKSMKEHDEIFKKFRGLSN